MYVGELQNKKRFQEQAVFIPAEEREIRKWEFNFIDELCISLLIHIRDAFLKSTWRLSGWKHARINHLWLSTNSLRACLRFIMVRLR